MNKLRNMILKIGDKVRFLNEVGEGYIVNFKNKEIAEVAIEAGFEIPMLISELIKVNEEPKVNKPLIINSFEEVLMEEEKKKAPSEHIKGEQGVFLVFEPEVDVFSSTYKVQMINNTSLQVLFSYSIHKGNMDIGLASGILEPLSAKLLHTAKRAEIDTWDNVFIQSVFHRNGAFRVIMPLDKRIIIKVQRLTQVNLLKATPVIGFDAYHFPVIELKEELSLDLEKLEQTFSAKHFREKAAQDNKKDKKIVERESNLYVNPKNGYMEVDLHIEELLDDYEGMTNGGIVQVQLKHCRKAIDKALLKRAGKLTIIHGVGNGTLKSEVRNVLRTYKDLQYYDAPADKFGYGATEVILK
jgi:hypothetical protein